MVVRDDHRPPRATEPVRQRAKLLERARIHHHDPIGFRQSLQRDIATQDPDGIVRNQELVGVRHRIEQHGERVRAQRPKDRAQRRKTPDRVPIGPGMRHHQRPPPPSDHIGRFREQLRCDRHQACPSLSETM
jgi:hypothetical protein